MIYGLDAPQHKRVPAASGKPGELTVTPGHADMPSELGRSSSPGAGRRPPKRKVGPYFASHEILTARNAGCTKTPLPPDSLDRVPGRQRHLLVRVMAKRQDVQVTPTPKW